MSLLCLSAPPPGTGRQLPARTLRRTARRLCTWTLLVGLGSTLPVARAGGPRASSSIDTATPEMMQTARAYVTAGKASYQRGEYTAARREFEQAYALLPLPEFLRNLTQTADKQGQLDEAIRYAESYLASSPSEEEAAEMTRYLADLRTRRAQAVPLVTARDSAPPRRPGLAPPLAVAGAGLALLAIGGGLGIAALLTQQQANDMLHQGPVNYVSLQSTLQRGSSLNIAAITFDVIGGVGLVGGLAWLGYVVHQRRSPTPLASPREAPAAGATR